MTTFADGLILPTDGTMNLGAVNPALTELPKNLKVVILHDDDSHSPYGRISITGTQIKEIPEGFSGDVDARNSPLETIHPTARMSLLYADNTQLREIPEGVIQADGDNGADLSIKNTPIRHLPAGLKLIDLEIEGSALETLPADLDLSEADFFSVKNTNIIEIPSTMKLPEGFDEDEMQQLLQECADNYARLHAAGQTKESLQLQAIAAHEGTEPSDQQDQLDKLAAAEGKKTIRALVQAGPQANRGGQVIS